MTFSKIIYRLSYLNPGVEFLALLSWMLFFPMRDSKDLAYIYFLGLAVLVVLFSIRNLLVLKNVALSAYTLSLTIVNLVFLVSVIFSVYHFRSLASYADIFLLSFYAGLFFLDQYKKNRYYYSLLYMITFFSILEMIHYLVSVGKGSLFFSNPILQGAVSGVGVLVALYFLLQDKDNRPAIPFPAAGKIQLLLLLFFNSGGVFVSRSKAAFIGIFCFALLLVMLRKKILIPILLVAVILTFLVPNPVRDSFIFSITKDPYALDRPKIWQVSVDIFRDNPLTGAGLDNFAEVAKKYNFKQSRGLANYYKVPQQSHNDYLKVIAEAGLPGLLMLVALLFVTARKIFSAPLFDITRILILYLMFQAFLFNILFRPFFLFLFLFLLKMLFEKDLSFMSPSRLIKVACSCVLVFALLTCYLLPFLANLPANKARITGDSPGQVNRLLDRAIFFNPLNIEFYFMRAQAYFEELRETGDLKYFHLTMADVKKIQRLNPHFTGSYILESSVYNFLFTTYEQTGSENYVSLTEIVSPLLEAEKFSPFDPFIRMHVAQAYLDFGETGSAREAAVEAYRLEPQYIAALYFLHKNFDYFGSEEEFRNKLAPILQRKESWSLEPGTYLYELVRIPGGLQVNQ